jgi:peptidoglycan/LPS O-acetylase OafA/YrhL
VSQDQISAFYHDLFIKNQVDDFIALSGFSITPSLDNIVDNVVAVVFSARRSKIVSI